MIELRNAMNLFFRLSLILRNKTARLIYALILEIMLVFQTAVCLAQEHGVRFVYVSAKTGYNVERLFHSMGNSIFNHSHI